MSITRPNLVQLPHLTTPSTATTLIVVQDSAVDQYLTVDEARILLQIPVGPTGAQGPIGYWGSQGYTGSIGFTGSRGYTGSLGYIGSTGYTGSQGIIGFTGSSGYTGSLGYIGSTGYTGSQGLVGFTGSLGYTGSVGPPSSTATNILGGNTGSIVIQTATNYTGFVNIGASGALLQSNGTNPEWISTTTLTVGYSIYSTQEYITQLSTATSPTARYPTMAVGAGGYAALGSTLDLVYYTDTKILSVGGINATNTTTATSTNTGALIVAGGAGIGGNLYVGGSLIVTNGLISNTATNIAGGLAGQLVVQTGTGYTGFVSTGTTGTVLVSRGTSTPVFQNTLTLAGTVATTSTNSGALQVAGGVGVGGSIFVGDTVTAASVSTLQIITYGTDTNLLIDPTGTGKALFSTSTQVLVVNTNTSTSTTTGALVVAGGIGIGGNLYVGGEIVAQKLTIQLTTVTTNLVVTDDIISTYNTTDSTGTDSGALIVAGGAGIGKNLYVGGLVRFINTTSSTSTTTGALVVSGGVGIGGAVYINNTSYINGSAILTAATVGAIVSSITAGTDTAVSTSTGAITIWNTSTLQSVTNRGNSTTNTLLVSNTTSTVNSTSTGAVVVYGGVGIGNNLTVKNDIITQYGDIGLGNTVTTGSTWTGGSLAFNGTNPGQALSVTSSSALQFGTNTFTIEGWFYYVSSGYNQYTLSRYAGGAGWSLQMYGTVEFNNNVTNARISTVATVPYNTWTHIAVVREGTGANQTKIYVNGVLSSSGTCATNFNDSSTFCIGGHGVAASYLDFNGNMSNVRITNGTALYTSGFTPAFPLAPAANTAYFLKVASSGASLIDSSANAFTVTPFNFYPSYSASAPTVTSNITTSSFALHVSTSTGALEFRPNTYSSSISASSSIFSLANDGSATITSNPISITNTTTAVSSLTGALLVAGGAGIRGDLWVGGNVYVLGTAVNDRANNINGGGVGQILFQSATSSTSFVGTGTAGQILISNGSTSTGPTFVGTNTITIGTATTLAGGTLQSIHYQSSTGTTAFLAASNTSGWILSSNGTSTAPSWIAGAGSAASATTATYADNIKTLGTNTNAAFYPTFVDSNNATGLYEPLYTTSTLSINPSTGKVTVNALTNISSDSILTITGSTGTNQQLGLYINNSATSQYAGFRIVGLTSQLTQIYSNGTMQVGPGATGSNTDSYIQIAPGGIITFNGNSGAEKGRFDAAGAFMIGTTSTTLKFEVVGTAKITGNFTATGSLTVGVTTASSVAGEIRATNEITAYYSSDARLKENVQPIENPIAMLEAIRGVYFDWTAEHIEKRGGEDGYFVRKHDIGVIAQEVEKILPEIVATRADGFKAVKYEKIVPLLIEAIKAQQAEIEQMKKLLK